MRKVGGGRYGVSKTENLISLGWQLSSDKGVIFRGLAVGQGLVTVLPPSPISAEPYQ